jgi:hypothetical protein
MCPDSSHSVFSDSRPFVTTLPDSVNHVNCCNSVDRANLEFRSSGYATPVFGLSFLRYDDIRFTQKEKELEGKGSGRRMMSKEGNQDKGDVFATEISVFAFAGSAGKGAPPFLSQTDFDIDLRKTTEELQEVMG